MYLILQFYYMQCDQLFSLSILISKYKNVLVPWIHYKIRDILLWQIKWFNLSIFTAVIAKEVLCEYCEIILAKTQYFIMNESLIIKFNEFIPFAVRVIWAPDRSFKYLGDCCL